MTELNLTTTEWNLVASALESEIEHSNDYCKDMDDSTEEGREAIIAERKRGQHLETIREHILSATYAPAGHPLNAYQPFISR